MLADDLVRRIALDALGARRSSCVTSTFRVEHEDGVVGDALDEDAEVLLGFEQRLCAFRVRSCRA